MASLIAALCGCNEFGFDPIDPDTAPSDVVVVEDVFVQAPLPAVDVLFVIDETQSMEQEFAVLSTSVASMMTTLDDLGLRWHIGVVGANMVGEGAGELRGRPWVLTPETLDREQAMADLLRVTPGVQSEAGLAAMVRALELSGDGGANEGFRRPDASLQVVFVADDDDGSDLFLDDPIPDAIAALRSTDGKEAVASALVGDVPGGCTSARGTALPGDRYVSVAEATGGMVASVCDADFGAVLEEVGRGSVVLPRRFGLSAVPDGDAINVLVDGDPVETFVVELDEAGELATLVFDEAPPAASAVVVTYPVSNR